MDGLREPIGPEAGEVYWRRRIVALTLVVLALVVAYFLIVSPGGDTTKDSPSTTPAPTVSAAPSAQADDLSRACTADDVTLTATPNPFTFGAGALPVIEVSVTHTGATPCVISTGGADSGLEVWSGGESNKDVYFSTAYCPEDGTITDRQLLLQQGATELFQVTWNRQRVGEGCTTGATPGDGFYWAQVTLQGIAAEPAQFELTSA